MPGRAHIRTVSAGRRKSAGATMHRNFVGTASLFALAFGVSVQAQDTLARSTPVITGPATTIPAVNAPIAASVVTRSDTSLFAPSLETLLDGKVPGATIESSTSDAPGEGMQVALRGITSVLGTNAPLYVVDGVIVFDQSVNFVNALGVATPPEGNGINHIVFSISIMRRRRACGRPTRSAYRTRLPTKRRHRHPQRRTGSSPGALLL